MTRPATRKNLAPRPINEAITNPGKLRSRTEIADGVQLEKLKALFTPIKIGPLELSNRIIMPAITTLYDVEDSSRWVDFYAERARGGAGLLIVGGLQTLFPGRISRLGKPRFAEKPPRS